MQFKEKKMRDQLFGAHTLLMDMAREFERASMELGIEPVVTRVTDHFDGESGVHLYGRAMDFRDEHRGDRLYTDSEVKIICDKLNKKFKRYDGKSSCIHHSFNEGPAHFHVQVASSYCAYKKADKPKLIKEEGHGQLEESP